MHHTRDESAKTAHKYRFPSASGSHKPFAFEVVNTHVCASSVLLTMNSATFDCGSSSTESLTLFSAKANPFRAPTSNELRAIDYLDICWRPNQSCKDDFALPLMLSASASRRTSATSVSHYSAADVTEQQQSPQKQHQPLKRTACSCQSLGDNDDEGSIEFIDTTDDEEKEVCGGLAQICWASSTTYDSSDRSLYRDVFHFVNYEYIGAHMCQ